MFVLLLGLLFLAVYAIQPVRDSVCAFLGIRYDQTADLITSLGASLCLTSSLGLLGLGIVIAAFIYRSRSGR